MNLFDFTYCGDYNRQIVNLAGIVPERWSYSGTEDNGILKRYLEQDHAFSKEERRILEEIMKMER